MIKKILIITQKANVSTHLNQLQIKINDVDESIPIEDIGALVLENHEIIISNHSLNSLIENKTVVITCNFKHLPSGYLLPIAGNVLHTNILKKQINTKTPLIKNLWMQIIKAKLLNQALVLKKIGAENKPLIYFSQKVVSGDKLNLEARGALFYWDNLFDKKLNFRRNYEGDGINALLNYGYSIIRGLMARAIVSSGLHPAIGLHHKNQYNPFCLADDLMEPFRPFVDLKIYEHIKITEDFTLTTSIKKILVSILFDDVLLNNERKPMQLAFTSITQNLIRCFDKESKKLIFPKINETK